MPDWKIGESLLHLVSLVSWEIEIVIFLLQLHIRQFASSRPKYQVHYPLTQSPKHPLVLGCCRGIRLDYSLGPEQSYRSVSLNFSGRWMVFSMAALTRCFYGFLGFRGLIFANQILHLVLLKLMSCSRLSLIAE